MEERQPSQVFDGVVFTIIPSEKITGEEEQQIRTIIPASGGRFVSLDSEDAQISDLDQLTHIISTHIDFPQYTAALEQGISVVRPSWVSHSIAKNKMGHPRQHSPDPNQYFGEVVMTTAGLPEGDQDAIVAGVIALGGQYSPALSRLVTHIVTLDSDTSDKCRVAREKQLKIKVVLPHWFDDCFKLGKRISEGPYMFPDPEILRTNQVSRIRDLPSTHIEGATVAVPPGMPSSTPPSSPSEARKNLSALKGKSIFFDPDLQLSDRLHQTLSTLVKQGGGDITDSVDDAGIFIGQYRDSEGYVTASRAGIEVANLSWLYHVINQNRYTSPLRKLLHYPVPRAGIPGFENMRISISNYQGDARIYVENLIHHAGAVFTKTMKQDNTHLITAHLHSEKVEAAQEWGLHIVNHIWLEESYAKCAAQTLTNPKYLTFPARTNLGEVTGQTSFDMKRVERMYFRSPGNAPSPVKSGAARPAVPVLPPHAAEQAPFVAAPDEEFEEPQTIKKPRGRPPKAAATPKVRDEEKENESPLLTATGRASKTKAMGLLHQQADDIALYNKEMKRKGGVTHGGRRSDQTEDVSSPAPVPELRKKRPSEEATYDVSAEGTDLSDGETQLGAKPAKKVKRPQPSGDLPQIEHRMMVTGDDRWLSSATKESQDRTKLRALGVQLTQDPKVVTILVAPKILRTRKFVAALAGAPLVVDTKFLDVALKQNKLVKDPHALQDRDTEERFGFKLKDSLERARINQRRLLRGWSIFITKDVPGGFDTYRDIISLNGGDALLYTGRTGLSLPKRRLRNDPDAGGESQHQGGDDEFDFVYLVSGNSDAEMKLWKTFRDMAEKQDLQARIVRNDWLLNAAMSQQVAWDRKWELSGSD